MERQGLRRGQHRMVHKETPRWRMEAAVERHRRRGIWQHRLVPKDNPRCRMDAKVDQHRRVTKESLIIVAWSTKRLSLNYLKCVAVEQLSNYVCC